MDIYERLEKDHSKLRDVGERIAATEGGSNERRTLWEEFKTELRSHANAEEQTFYAALLKAPETQEKVRHSVHEHEEVDEIVEELDGMDMSDGGWLTRFKTLRDDVEHHADEEESDVFPTAREVLDDDTAASMVSAFDERKLAEA